MLAKYWIVCLGSVVRGEWGVLRPWKIWPWRSPQERPSAEPLCIDSSISSQFDSSPHRTGKVAWAPRN